MRSQSAAPSGRDVLDGRAACLPRLARAGALLVHGARGDFLGGVLIRPRDSRPSLMCSYCRSRFGDHAFTGIVLSLPIAKCSSHFVIVSLSLRSVETSHHAPRYAECRLVRRQYRAAQRRASVMTVTENRRHPAPVRADHRRHRGHTRPGKLERVAGQCARPMTRREKLMDLLHGRFSATRSTRC